MNPTSTPPIRVTDAQTKHCKSPEQVRTELANAGVSIAAWAAQHGFSIAVAQQVVAGRLKGRAGESRLIAIALGLVPDSQPKDPSQVLPPSASVLRRLGEIRQQRRA